MKKFILFFSLLTSFSLSYAMKTTDKVYEYQKDREFLYTLFEVSVRCNQPLLIPDCVKNGVDINQRLQGGQPAVHIALYKRQKELFDILIKQPSFNPQACNWGGATALIYALTCAEEKDYPHDLSLHFIQSLLALDSLVVDATHNDGPNALEVAACSNREFFTLILNAGAQPRARLLGSQAHWVPGVSDLLQGKNLVQEDGSFGVIKPAVHYAIRTNNSDLFNEALARKNFDPNIKDEEHKTPVMVALCISQNPKKFPPEFIKIVIKKLTDHPLFDPNAIDNEGQTALMLALLLARENKSPADLLMCSVKTLVNHPRTNINIETGDSRYSALDCAPVDMRFIPFLLEHGAQPRIPRTFYRAEERSPELFNFLIENSPVAVHYAIFKNDQALFDRIRALPTFDPNAFYNHTTPLGWCLARAVDKNRSYPKEFIWHVFMSLLHSRGINIECEDSQKFTAMGHAIIAGLEYVKELLRRGASVGLLDYKLAQCQGAPGVFDHIRKLKITIETIEETPPQFRHLSLPPGTYTYEEIAKGTEARSEAAKKEKNKKNCRHCNQPDCVIPCPICKQVYYCSQQHKDADRERHNGEMHKPKECAICHELEKHGRQEKCGHTFHEGCLQRWLNQQNQKIGKSALCPVCQTYLDLNTFHQSEGTLMCIVVPEMFTLRITVPRYSASKSSAKTRINR